MALDPRMLQAGVAMGLGLLLFIPTFNALNNSYVTDVTPPPWVPTPKEIPDNFEPPEDWTPPEDWEPPEGDYEIPEEWKEKYKDKMPPGGKCPAPAVRPIQEVNATERLDTANPSPVGGGPGDPFRKTYRYNVHETALAVRIYVNLTGWRGTSFEAAVAGPPNATAWSDDETGPGYRTFLSPNVPTSSARFEYDSLTVEGQKQVKPGDYDLRVVATEPDGGDLRIEGYVALACGGMLAS